MLDLPILFFCGEGQTMGTKFNATGYSMSHSALGGRVEALDTTNQKSSQPELEEKNRNVEREQ